MLEGLFTGVLGSALALVATWAIYRFISDNILELSWLPGSWLFAGLGIGAVVGLASSTIAVRRHLREIT